ncbi:MAG: flagellar basal body P-ring formation chaperone FlgA [Planctomycetota bacterium]
MQARRGQPDRRWRPPILLAMGLAVGLSAGVASADTVRLHPEAATTDREVTLGEVADLDGPAAEALSGVVIADWPEVVQRSRLSLSEVRAKLDAAGANWAKLSLEGPPHCHVAIVEPVVETPIDAEATPLPEPETAQADANVFVSNGSTPEPGYPTLRREIATRLIGVSGLPAGDVRVVFDGDHDLLDGPITGPTRLRPTTSATIGTVAIVVETLGPHGDVAQRREVRARVERRVHGLITTRSLRSDRALTAEDVEVAELWLDHPDAQPLMDPTAAVGLKLRSPVAAGKALYAEHLKALPVIRRGELVNVRVVAGGLVVRSTGVAMHNAAVGEAVRVRRAGSRETFEAVAVGFQEATIRLEEPASPAGGTQDTPRPDALAATVERLQRRYHAP